MIKNDMIYIPYKWDLIGYSEDNGQAMIKSDCCTRYSCQIWNDSVAFAPKLLKTSEGSNYCPNCCYKGTNSNV